MLSRHHPHLNSSSDRALTDSPSLRDDESLRSLDLEEEVEMMGAHEEEEVMSDQELRSEKSSGGGFCPPAWRRGGSVGVEERNSSSSSNNGFWRPPPRDNFGLHLPSYVQTPFARLEDPMLQAGKEVEEAIKEEEDMILDAASRTRLPFSPEKEREDSPARSTVAQQMDEKTAQDNYIRFGIRAEVQQRTEPIETVIKFARNAYRRLTSTYTSLILSLLVACLAYSTGKALLNPAPQGLTYDLVKVAGVARSFEPLIYYSENAVIQVHDLQATSLAVWDLGESVRTSGLDGGEGIVSDLNSLSETMKTLGLEMTRFFTRVDGDIDGILNVMNWARLHLVRLQKSRSPSPLSSLYDNIHSLLPSPDSPSSPIGRLTTALLPPSSPQREAHAIQKLFTEFLSTLEEAITAELHHAITLFALFEAVDTQFLNLARGVARERTAQEERQEEFLASLWVSILGPNARDLRNFEKNRALLHDVREKTVRNKGILLDHNGKLLTLKASLEGLRTRLVSPLVRGANASELSLEDQIEGLSDVVGYLSAVRQEQKGRVMEQLFASVPGKRGGVEGGAVVGQIV